MNALRVPDCQSRTARLQVAPVRKPGAASLAALALVSSFAFVTVAGAAPAAERQDSKSVATVAPTTGKSQPAKKKTLKTRPVHVTNTSSAPTASATVSSTPAPVGDSTTAASRPIATGASSGYGVAPMSAPTANIASAVRTPPADEARVGELANAVDTAADNDATPAARPNPNRYVTRFRLDDGRYRGFHQNNPDELRTGDAVQTENDRIRADHRARGRDLYP
jgi:hypothetical protein